MICESVRKTKQKIAYSKLYLYFRACFKFKVRKVNEEKRNKNFIRRTDWTNSFCVPYVQFFTFGALIKLLFLKYWLILVNIFLTFLNLFRFSFPLRYFLELDMPTIYFHAINFASVCRYNETKSTKTKRYKWQIVCPFLMNAV